MGRPRNAIHYSFEGGQADPQYERRADADLWLLTAKKLRNVRLLNGGGFARRPGMALLSDLDGPARLREFITRSGNNKMLVLRDGCFDIFTNAGLFEDNVTGAAWVEDDLSDLQFAAENDRCIVTSRSFWPQEIVCDALFNFSVGDLAFTTRADGSKGQPYYRFSETKGITLTPSALSGAGVTLTATGGSPFVAGHVGTRFRILGREIQITGYTSSALVTGTVITPLYPTRRLTVGSSAPFAVGDQCLSSVDDIEMEIGGIPDATHVDVVLTGGVTDPGTTSNTLLGPNGSSAISAVGAAAAIIGTTQWDEQMISSVRGYPGGCIFHKGRLVLFDFPKAPEIHAFSVLREPGDFDTGDADDADGILDGPGDAVGRRVRHCVSSEQLLSLTLAGSYYVGEGPNSPVTATTVEFLRIGPEPVSACNPILAAEGVVFVENQAGRLMLLAPSGQLRRVWGATEILAIATELLDRPKRLLLVDGCGWGPERYILAVNDDGTMVAVHYRRDSEVAGATPWDTNGSVFDIERTGDEVWACVLRDGAYFLERFDTDRLLDNSVVINNASGATPADASWAASASDVALVWRKTASGEDRRVEIGAFTADGAGALTDAPTYERTYEGGLRFDVETEMWPPIDPEAGASEHQRISAVSVDTLDAGQFYVAGRRLTPYRASDDITEPPPLRTGWRKQKMLGRKRDFVVDLYQTEAAPLTVRCVTMEVR